MAGINAHINHDLPQAIVATTEPILDTSQYADYTALNATLDSVIDPAKHTLLCRLLGDPLPPVSHVEDLVAAFSVSIARELAWQNSEILAHLKPTPLLFQNFIQTLDSLTTSTNEALLIPVTLVV